MENKDEKLAFSRKVWITGGILSLIVILILLFKATFAVFLLILAGALIAIFFRGLSGLICRKTHWKEGYCLASSVIGTILLIALLFWFIGAKIGNQISELSDTFPRTVQNAEEQIRQNPIGNKILDEVTSPESVKKAKSIAGTFFKSTFGIFGDLYVILFLGIFFTVSPGIYKNGIIQLVPDKGKKKAEDVLNQCAGNLKKWLKGQIFAMFVVTVLTAIGLVILGIPMWLALAVIAGILNFIPNFGPLIAMIPAVMVAFLQGPVTALIVAGLYILVQVAESNFITPMVQRKMINIAPALIIIAQLLISPLTGAWGLVLATPLMVIIIVLVKELYIKKHQQEELTSG
jgi:predicted PurR-regulated permease PerM